MVFDPDPDSFRSPWRTYRHLLETTPGEATHRVQIQDDATVCDNFHEVASRAIRAQPDRLLVFFVGANPKHHADAVLAACARDETWADLGWAYWCPVVSTCWPVGLIDPFLRYVDAQNWRPSYASDDEIVGRFLREKNIRPLATVPSLVEHRDVVPSVGRNAPRRHRLAACWVGDCQGCADGIAWTS